MGSPRGVPAGVDACKVYSTIAIGILDTSEPGGPGIIYRSINARLAIIGGIVAPFITMPNIYS